MTSKINMPMVDPSLTSNFIKMEAKLMKSLTKATGATNNKLLMPSQGIMVVVAVVAAEAAATTQMTEKSSR